MDNSKEVKEKEKMVLKKNREREEHYDRVLEEVLLEKENIEQGGHSPSKHKKIERVRI
jgi:hypothetical protein